jgi:hypothetical protein
MMSSFEKNIKENRSELDRIEMPDTNRIWRGIQQEMKGEANTSPNGWSISIGKYWQWSIAASVCLLIAAYFIFRPVPHEASQQVDLASYYPELADQQDEYVQLIQQKESEMNIGKLDKASFADIFKELEMLDNIHQETLEDVPKYIDNEQLVRTLIRYYEQKIKILERLSKEVAKQQYDEEKNHERSL